MKHVIGLSGGKDSTALALRLAEVEPRDYEYICNETGNELPEMQAHWAKLEQMLGKPIVRVRYDKDLQGAIRQMNMLPSVFGRWCTRVLKIEPTIDYMATLPAGSTLYVGLRADEEERKGLYGEDIAVRFPMREWGWKEADVWAYLDQRGVGIPKHFQRQLERLPGRRLGLGAHLRPLGNQFLILTISGIHGGALLVVGLGEGGCGNGAGEQAGKGGCAAHGKVLSEKTLVVVGPGLPALLAVYRCSFLVQRQRALLLPCPLTLSSTTVARRDKHGALGLHCRQLFPPPSDNKNEVSMSRSRFAGLLAALSLSAIAGATHAAELSLVRYGPAGQEKPGLVDAQGQLHDLSAHITDITPDVLSDESLNAIAAIPLSDLPLVQGSPRFGVPYDLTVSNNCGNISIALTFTGRMISLPEDYLCATDDLAGVNYAGKMLFA